MATIYKGVRTFVEALRKGADWIFNALLDAYNQLARVRELFRTRYPDLGPTEVQMVEDFTLRTRAWGAQLQSIALEDRLDKYAPPFNAGYVGSARVWAEVSWADPETGIVGARSGWFDLIAGETRAQFEERAKEKTGKGLNKSPERDKEGNIIESIPLSVQIIRGYTGNA